jgi:hypothetical protein
VAEAFTTAGFARMIERAAAVAGLQLKAHPHMLRHACGYALGRINPAPVRHRPLSQVCALELGPPGQCPSLLAAMTP